MASKDGSDEVKTTFDRISSGGSDSEFWSALGGLGLRGIRGESDRLEREKTLLNDTKRSLAFDHYRAFIGAADCGRQVESHVEKAVEKAGETINLIPNLRQTSVQFEEKSQELLQRRKRLSLVLSKHTSLLEILELPQLVENAVRNQEYEQALQLRAFAARIDKKLGHIPIVAQVVQSVDASASTMVNQLLAQLKAPVQLPACLKIVGFLRRSDAFTETELRLRFLQARDAWLQGLLMSVPKDDPQEHLTKVMDLTRVNLFDVVTQYRALFSDDDLDMTSPSSGDQVKRSPSAYRLLFSSWLTRRLQGFLRTMEEDLERGGGDMSLESVAGQAMYFGQSFGRVGADFRSGIVKVLLKAARLAAFRHFDGAERRFAIGVEQLALKADISMRPQVTTNTSGSNEEEIDPLRPPPVLMDFLPLAELCNSVLSSLNQIRLATPLALCFEMTERVQSLFDSGCRTLCAREARFNQSTSTETELQAFKRLVSVFYVDLLPYLDRCLKAAFPPIQVTKVIGNVSGVTLGLDFERVYEMLPKNFRPERLVLPLPTAAKGSVIKEGVDSEVPSSSEPNDAGYVIDRQELIDQEIEATENKAAETE